MLFKLYAASSVLFIAIGVYTDNMYVVAWNTVSLGFSLYIIVKEERSSG